MRIKIKPSIACGEINVPPSKSYAHRLLIASGLSNNECTVGNIALSEDILATLDCLKALGKNIEILNDINSNNKTIKISTEKSFEELPNEIILNCNESGSTLRFFIPIALLTGKTITLKGTEKLISRGILPYEEICNKQNIEIIKTKSSITFRGNLVEDEFIIPGNISSQFITGLLFALPLLKKDSKIVVINGFESKNYVDITIDVLRQSGIKISKKDNIYTIYGNQSYACRHFDVEGDYSNAAFLDAFNYIGGNVKLHGLNKDSYQGDKIFKEYFEKLSHGYEILDIGNCIDLGPILFIFAAMMNGAKFTNTNRLKIKESDRIAAVKNELIKFGAIINDYDNFVEINKCELSSPKIVLNGQNDHRIVMALTVMASKFGAIIDGAEAIKKSYPNFFEDIKKLGIEVEYDIK